MLSPSNFQRKPHLQLKSLRSLRGSLKRRNNSTLRSLMIKTQRSYLKDKASLNQIMDKKMHKKRNQRKPQMSLQKSMRERFQRQSSSLKKKKLKQKPTYMNLLIISQAVLVMRETANPLLSLSQREKSKKRYRLSNLISLRAMKSQVIPRSRHNYTSASCLRVT